jgi:lysophospholipase L1-like esterase
MDIGNAFLQPDGTLPKEIMPDLLHLNAKGYEMWAAAIEGKVAELMK